MNITASNMSHLTKQAFSECIFQHGNANDDFIIVEGVFGNFIFNCQHLEEHRNLITSLIAELPCNPQITFTICDIRTNRQGFTWTNDLVVCDCLVAMAIGLNLMFYSLPKNMWHSLPRGLPYILLN